MNTLKEKPLYHICLAATGERVFTVDSYKKASEILAMSKPGCPQSDIIIQYNEAAIAKFKAEGGDENVLRAIQSGTKKGRINPEFRASTITERLMRAERRASREGRMV